MKKRLIDLLKRNHENKDYEFCTVFGLPTSFHYDALIVSLVWEAADVFSNEICKIQVASQHTSISAYIIDCILDSRLNMTRLEPGYPIIHIFPAVL